MRVEDKLKLLDQFPELLKQFSSKFLDKFNDQPEEEAKFWDEFWRLQKERKTLLYGGEAKDSKEIMNQLPVFTENDNEETIKFEDAVDALNLQEMKEEIYERFMFPGQTDDRLDNIAMMINNHSIMIKSKDKQPLEKLLRDMKVDVDPDQDNVVSSAMDVEKIDRKIEKQKKYN